MARYKPGDEAAGCGTSLAYGLGGAIIIGFPSFLVGFIGPLIFAPHASQGPLLGIFITGPAGAVVGFFAGALFAQLRQPKR